MKDKKKIAQGILIVSFLAFIVFPVFSAAQYTHPGDHDEPSLIESLIGKEMVWQVINASGVYYTEGGLNDPGYRPGSFIKYEVLSLDYENEQYDVSISEKYYTNNDFKPIGTAKSDFLLISRDWGNNMVRYVVEENDEFWGSQARINQAYDSTFTTTWWEFNMINTYTVTFIMNETNYEELVYTRAEGILLSRTAVVASGEGGYLKVELVSYSGALTLSPWYYVIIGASLFGIILITLIVGSLESQRKKLMRIREEEIKGRSYLGAFIGVLITIYGLMNIVNIAAVQITATETQISLAIDAVHLMFTICGLLLIIMMSMKENKYRKSGIAIGIGTFVFGLLIIIDYFLVYAQMTLAYSIESGNVYLSIFGYIPGWSFIFMFPLGIVLLILGIFISFTLSLKEGHDVIFLKSVCTILILIGVFCLVDYALNIFSDFELDLTPFDHWTFYVSGYLGIGFVLLVPLLTFLIYTKKR